MRVPLLDLSEQYRALAEPIREAIDDVLASHRFILGPKGEAFEKAMCAYCKAPHAIGVSSGTDAFLAILTALGIGAGDAVVTTRSEEHTSELQSLTNLVCRLLLE